jgi:spermidine dehydrogenase
MKRKRLTRSDAALGMGRDITRKDFLNSSLLGVGATLLGAASPAAALERLRGNPSARSNGTSAPAAPAAPAAPDPWTGYAGVGDYARANGNTLPVLANAHMLRDGTWAKLPSNTKDTGELYDLVVVGGGISGLSAAYYFHKQTGGSKKCLVLENHPIFGGEARENDFLVNGERLIAPQGSNQGSIPRAGSGTPIDEIWTDLNLAREVEYQQWDKSLTPLRFQLDNYAHMEGVNESMVDVGYYFDEGSGVSKPTWLRNIWADDLATAPFSDEVKRDLLKWRSAVGESTEEFRRRLDTMSYKDYIEKVLGLRPEVTKMAEPVVGLINGASPDAVSAFAASQIGMPGVTPRVRGKGGPLTLSFPGGNVTYTRCYVRHLIPAAMPAATDFAGILTSSIDFAALDRPAQPVRIRLGATVVKVEHAATADHVVVAYEQGGRVYRVKAKGVVMASYGFANKLVISDLPEEIKAAYGEFSYGPAMVVNVALTNWRFLYKLGAPACRWFDDGFGFSCNIRRPMIAGSYRPPLHPDKPTVMTFYVGLYTPGKTAQEQGVLGRNKMLSTSYAEWERTIRAHMVRLYGDHGFNPKTDIAGIILNRWGHARVLQPPGWHYGRDGKPAPREVVEKGFGRIVIAHSELNGHQNATGAMAQGKRAAAQIGA